MYSKRVVFRTHIREQHFNTQNNDPTTLIITVCKPSTMLIVYLAEKACDVIPAVHHRDRVYLLITERVARGTKLTNKAWEERCLESEDVQVASVALAHQAFRQWHAAQSRAGASLEQGLVPLHFSDAHTVFPGTQAWETVSALVMWGPIT